MDDPKRPHKMYVAIAVAFLTTFVAESAGNLPWYVNAILVSLITGAAVYLKGNPKIRA